MGLFQAFGTGKAYVPQATPEQQVAAQGVFDIFSLFDKETVDKVKELIHAIDVKKIEAVMKTLEVEKDGRLHLNIDLTIKK